jgi:5'-3' exonuclease
VGEKTAAELLRKHGSLEAVLDSAIREPRERLRLSLTGSRDELLAYKEIATLQKARVRRPRDRETDWRGGARAARKRGMNRLAERLTERAG